MGILSPFIVHDLEKNVCLLQKEGETGTVSETLKGFDWNLTRRVETPDTWLVQFPIFTIHLTPDYAPLSHSELVFRDDCTSPWRSIFATLDFLTNRHTVPYPCAIKSFSTEIRCVLKEIHITEF